MHRFLFTVLLGVAILFPRAGMAAASYRCFWLTETITGQTIGPIVNKPGHRFTVDRRQWIVMEAAPGEISFADSKTLGLEGPYDLIEQRIIGLGKKAYVFTRIQDFEGTDPDKSVAVLSQAVRAPAQSADTEKPWTKDLPARWVLAPVPSTNPGTYRANNEQWSLQQTFVSPSVLLFAEPLHKIECDWKLGGQLGKTKSELETKRYGIAGQWRGIEAEAGIASGGKVSDTLVEDGPLVSDLKLGDCDGWFAALGYRYSFEIEKQWGVAFSVQASYESMDGTLSASVAAEKALALGLGDAVSAEEQTPGYGFIKWKNNTSWDRFDLDLAVALTYDEWYWGGSGSVVLNCLSEFSADGSLPVLESEYKLDAERTSPISFRISGWYSPADHLALEGSLTVGGETSLRLGVSYFF